MEEKRTYTGSAYLHFIVEADTVEEAFHIAFNNIKDAIHYIGNKESYQSARLVLVGQEDEIDANLEAEWKKGVLCKITTEREVF